MLGAGVAVAGQLHHGSSGRLGDGVVGLSASVPVGQRGGTMLAVSGEETLGVTFTHSHDLGGLGDGKLVFQNAVEHLNPGLFLLIQLYIPHRDDIFADQLAGDRIVDHQQVVHGYSATVACYRDALDKGRRPGHESGRSDQLGGYLAGGKTRLASIVTQGLEWQGATLIN